MLIRIVGTTIAAKLHWQKKSSAASAPMDSVKQKQQLVQQQHICTLHAVFHDLFGDTFDCFVPIYDHKVSKGREPTFKHAGSSQIILINSGM